MKVSKRIGDPGYAANWCIHYRASMDNTTCEAGVNYEDFKGGRWPCFLKPIGNNSLPVLQCGKFRPPTPEEIALHEQWIHGRFEKIAVAQQAIAPFRKTHRGKGFQQIECPVCKTGKLQFSIAGSNGHCYAGCTTDGCVSWME